jgi:hypothetical protein
MSALSAVRTRVRGWLATPAWLLVLVALLLFWRLLFAGRVLVWGTALLQFYQWETLAVEQWRAGEVPLWNASVGAGAPLLANLQSALVYPPNWLYLLVPVAHGMGWLAAAHVLWAGLGLYAFTRRLGLPPFAALVSALAFELNGYLIGRLTFMSITFALAWLPWLLFAAEGLLARRRTADAAWLALAIGLQLLAGHAQTSAYSLLGLGAYGLWRLVAGPAGGRRRVAALGLLAIALGVALAAVQLLPTAELTALSSRAAGVDRDAGLQYSFWPWRLLTLAAPGLFGSPAEGTYWGYGFYHEDHLYIGLLPLALALSTLGALLFVRVRRTARPGAATPAPAAGAAAAAGPLAAAGGLALFLAFGRQNPIFVWLFDRAVPLIVTFQQPTRWTLLFVLALCVLAGIGAARWQALGPGPEGPRGLRYWARLTLAGAAVLVVLLSVTREQLPALWQTFASGLLGPALLALAAAGLALVQPEPGRPRRARLWQAGVLALIAADLLATSYPLVLAADPAIYSGTTGAATALRLAGLGERRVYIPSDVDARARSAFLGGRYQGAEPAAYWWPLREAGLSNLAPLDGLRSASNFDPLLAQRYRRLLEAAGDDPERNLRVARLLAAGAIIWPGDAAGLEGARRAGWGAPLYPAGALNYYRVPGPLPRVSVVPAARLVAGEPEALAAIFDPELDLQTTAVLEAPASDVPDPRAPATFTATAAVLHETDATIRIAVTTSAASLLVLADTFYPGWEATVDGRPATLLRANYALRAVAVPAGASQVEMRYRPPAFQWGAVTTALSGAAVLGLILAGRRPRKEWNDPATEPA